MGRKARLKDHHAARPRPQIAARPRPNWPILVLSLVGMALTAYLSWAASSGTGLQGAASTAVRRGSLQQVGDAAGRANSGLGLARLRHHGGTRLRPARRLAVATWTVSFVGVLYSVYLTTVFVTLLGATCPYRLTSLSIMTALFAVATSQRPAEMPGFTWRRLLPARRPRGGGRYRAPASELRGSAGAATCGRGSVRTGARPASIGARGKDARRLLVSALRRAEGAVR